MAEIPADHTSPVTKAPPSPVTNEVEGAPEPNSRHDSRSQVYAKTFLAVFAICLIYFAQLVTLVGVGAQGQAIAGHFNGSTSVVWVSVPITILTVVLGPVISQAADYWGRKWFLVSLTMSGAVGSVLVGRATTMKMLIVGFTIVGVAFGAQPLLHTVTSEVLPRRWRAWGQAIDMTSHCLGAIFGLLVGGALNRANDPTSDGFRRYFLINMAWYAIAAILCAIVYNPPPLERQKQFTTAEKLAKLDWIGYLLLATGLVLFSVGLSYSKNPYEWTDPRLCHFRLACEGVAFFGANTYFAFQLSVLYETDALIVGVRYSIMLIAACVGALATGWYCATFRRVRWVTVAAFMIFLVFFICMATSNTGSSNAVWFYPVLLGTALGMTLTTLVTAAQLSTPPDYISVASGLIISVRSLGGTVALAIYNALFTDEMKHLGEKIAEAVIPDGLSPDALGDFIAALSGRNETALESIPGVTPQIISAGAQAILDTYVQAFRHVWITAACFVALAAIVASFLFDPQQEFNMHVDEPIEKLSDFDSTDAVNR
ncbi:siderophore iron transporter [Seiridium cupressi]